MDRMTIGALATATGIKVTTIRFYERAGLMPAPMRTAGRHRNYTNAQRRRLLFICKAREMEFSIKQIRMLLVLAEPARVSCGDVHQIAAAHLIELRRKIARLTKLERGLATAVEQCSEESGPQCSVLELLRSAD